MNEQPAPTFEVLLRRTGRVFVPETFHERLPEDSLRAVDLQLAELGYAVSTRLRARLERLPAAHLTQLQAWLWKVLAAHVGGDPKHQPLFRDFPNDTPSPFFKPSQVRALSEERITLKVLEAGTSVEHDARELLVSFCARKQALSPSDKDDFKTLIRDLGARTLAWLPEEIPVRENVAEIFGTLFTLCDPQEVLPAARRYLSTATDVLRLLAAYSGADPALLPQTTFESVPVGGKPARFWGRVAERLEAVQEDPDVHELSVPLRVHRFKVAPLRRPLRRALLALLEGFHPDALAEDMLRHRSYWVWLGEFLHPHEYADRFPTVARAFAIVRKKAPDGTPAPAFAGHASRLEAAVHSGDLDTLTQLLAQRPGELARRYDHALRVVGGDVRARSELVETFTEHCGELATPVLLTLYSHLPSRVQRARLRMYWPKGGTAKGVSSSDERPVLSPDAVAPSFEAIRRELLRRFSGKPAYSDFILDEELKHIPVPFNERTASRSAVALPRGARIPLPEGKVARLFLHWCKPEAGGEPTDIDLSVGFYTEEWSLAGVCSFRELQFGAQGGAPIAVHSGDLRDAPFPDGATEFVDLDRARALKTGLRYAVMVVNNYRGMPFSSLERGFAGVMLRDDVQGQHFDPRTVQLKFDLQGENGIFMPLVIDLGDDTLHWLDTYSKGQLEMNTAESSDAAVSKICPEMMEYFASGVRPSMYELALLHAAARGQRVTVRGAEPRVFVRGLGEDAAAFHARLRRGAGSAPAKAVPPSESVPVFAALYRGDVTLPPGSAVYALFREQVSPTLSASDLLS